MGIRFDVVVVGLGYVGLPLVKEACLSDMRVAGLDRNAELIAGLRAARSHVDDLSDADIDAMLSSGFHPTTDPEVISESDVIVICVPTPLGVGGGPDLGAVESAGVTISTHMTPGSLVVLESTTWPGTTEEILRPLLERSGLVAGNDFHLAFSPERIDPGNEKFGLRNTPKVVGGLTPECSDLAATFYRNVVDSVIVARGCREAEMAKLLENTYRHINIALVNEMAKFSCDLGIDFWNVVECARTKPFGFQSFHPGPGVGGHCIPIDPNYLSHHVRAELGYPFRFVELAQEINLSMPQYVARRAQDILNEVGKALRGSKVALLGVTYKPGIADERESPAIPLASHLRRLGANLYFYDALVHSWQVDSDPVPRITEDLGNALAEMDIVLHLQPHEEYGNELLSALSTPIFDTRGVLTGEHVVRL